MYWKFQKTHSIVNSRFDQLLGKFYEFGISGLVRENIQNSLDAQLTELNKPVIVKINTGVIGRRHIPGYQEIFSRVKALKPTNQYSREAIETMKSYLDKEQFSYLTFEDENTKGLSGAKKGQLDHDATSYSAYAYTKGVHFMDENLDKEKIRGGSHGVGKIASNAASIFNTMYFANCDEEGFKTLGGTSELMEHKYNGKTYRATGFFAKELDDGRYYPYENNQFHDIFKKETRGLKIIIPFLKEQYQNDKEIFRTVSDSFLLAILDGSLIVYINGLELNENTIKDYVTSDEYFEQTIENIKTYFTPLYLETLNHRLPDPLKVYDNNEPYFFNVFFYMNQNITSGRTGIFRSVGMKIEDFKVKSNVRKPYNAIIMPCSENEDQFLKGLENESHTKLDYLHIHSDIQQKNAEKFINNLHKEMAELIERMFEGLTDESGKMDTADILYYTENKFEKDLKKTMSVINISTGIQKSKILKVNDTDEEGKSQRKKNHGNGKFNRVKRVKKELGVEGKKTYYQLTGGVIKRVQFENREYLEVNLNDEPYFNDVTKGDLLISLVDGTGAEHYLEFDLRSEYRSIEDGNTYEKLEVTQNSIKSVDISTGIIKLTLKTNKSYNKTAKLRYYLEV